MGQEHMLRTPAAIYLCHYLHMSGCYWRRIIMLLRFDLQILVATIRRRLLQMQLGLPTSAACTRAAAC